MLSDLSDSRELFEAVLKAMADMVLVFDEEGRLIYYHVPAENEIILPQERWLGMRYRDVMGGDLGRRFDEAIYQTRSGTVANLEYCLDTHQGRRWFEAQISPSLENGHYQGAVAVVRDIDDYKRALDKLKLAGILFEVATEGICVCTTDGNIRLVNPAFTSITGYTADEVVGRNPRLLKSDRQDATFYAQLWHTLLSEDRWQGEIWNRRKNGEIFAEFLSIKAVRDRTQQVTHYIGVFNDLSGIKQRDDLIQHQAYHDPLTGLPNRDLLEDRLTVAIKQHERPQTIFAVAMLNIDNFKQINSSIGHAVGDQLLCQVAEMLSACVREGDTVARLGAERFVILLMPSGIVSVGGVTAAVRRLHETFLKPVICYGHELYVSVSLGLALFPADGSDSLSLLKHADLAVQHACEQGQNSYRFYSEELNIKLAKRFELETELHHALTENQFELYYQPVVAVADGHIAGVEALIRWRHPASGLIPPADFIPLAEENGLITAITEWVIRRVLRDRPLLGKLRVSVNISARDLADRRLENLFAEIAADQAIDFLTLELTENTLIEHRDEVLGTMARIRERGVKFSIDDFGTGYSSLSYLKRFPLDQLKIDRSFVVDLPHDEESVGIARAIIGLARSLNLALIAEGVENAAQYEFFKNEGCDYIQGYYFSKPRPLSELAELPSRFALPPTEQV